MNKKLLEKFKETLLKEGRNIEKELKTFAIKDSKIKGNWKSRFPKFNKEAGGETAEVSADQVEEYSTRLSIEHSLEIKLKNINLALEKIEKGIYGICEKCGKKIQIKRLEACPEARFCIEYKKGSSQKNTC